MSLAWSLAVWLWVCQPLNPDSKSYGFSSVMLIFRCISRGFGIDIRVSFVGPQTVNMASKIADLEAAMSEGEPLGTVVSNT